MIRWFLGLLAVLLIGSSTLLAQTRDSVRVLASPGGEPYKCCYNFVVGNRHQGDTLIDQVRVIITGGRASFIVDDTRAPVSWIHFESPDTVRWLANTDAEIKAGGSLAGFNVCVRDTGVFTVRWETYDVELGLLSSDTIRLACGNGECDEVFFEPLPGTQSCAFDFDLYNGNFQGKDINGLNIVLLTPGVRFDSMRTRQPDGWNRTRSKGDSLSWFSFSDQITRDRFRSGFRLYLIGAAPEIIVEYWTQSFDDIVCRTRDTLRCGITRVDSFFVAPVVVDGDTCCRDILVKNTHVPNTVLDSFSLRMLTPGASMRFNGPTPQGWTRTTSNVGDTITFSKTPPMEFNDQVIVQGLCFENAQASHDTIEYSLTTYVSDVPVSTATTRMICRRPNLVCDSLSGRADTLNTEDQCLYFTVHNRNSRGDQIRRIVARVERSGEKRSIVSATAPPSIGWFPVSVNADSVVYGGGALSSGFSAGAFNVCVERVGDVEEDTLDLIVTTYSVDAFLCVDTIRIATAPADTSTGGEPGACDSVSVISLASGDPGTCCYTLRFHNRNDKGKDLNGFLLRIPDPRVFITEGDADQSYQVTTPSFPSTSIGYEGFPVMSGDSTPPLHFCMVVDADEFPVTINAIWTSFSQGEAICTDTLKLICDNPPLETRCDTAKLVYEENEQGTCTYGFRILNLHTPGSAVDELIVSLDEGDGKFIAGQAVDDASGWDSIFLTRRELRFRGDELKELDSTERFLVTVDSTLGGPFTLQICTAADDLELCCVRFEDLVCAQSGVELTLQPTGFRLFESRPNPFTDETVIRYRLLRPGTVGLTVRDASGRIVRRYEPGMQETGEHSIAVSAEDLPSGVYFYTLEAGGELMTRQMVLVR